MLKELRSMVEQAIQATIQIVLGCQTKIFPQQIAQFAKSDWMKTIAEALRPGDWRYNVLYVSLNRPQQATDTELLEDQGILLRYRGKELVGVTVLEASKRRKADKKKAHGSLRR